VSYLTLAGEVHAELEVKRSRFLATVRRVPDEAAALESVAGHRRAHHAARHHCSAFVIGPDRSLCGLLTTASRLAPLGCRCSRCSPASGFRMSRRW
jgi:putative IMPACT (imprinted ancient) family translation regulator